MKKVGVISDTHGLLRKKALEQLSECDLILHAGDIGNLSIIHELEKIAPLKAIRGNIDKKDWATKLPTYETIEIDGKLIYMTHDLDKIDINPDGLFDVIIFGHSHKPINELKNRILYFNPGSAGPRRFDLPITVGRLFFSKSDIQGEIIELK